jgi:erythrocyte band 7 integral membrane protein
VEDHLDQYGFYGSFIYNCGECCGFLRTWMPCVCCCFMDYPYQKIMQSYAGLFERFGRYCKTVKPGLHYVNPCTDTLVPINLKIDVMDMQRQSVISKDNVMISIDASVYYRITNPRYRYYRVQNYKSAIAEVTYAVLKNICGQFKLQELLEKRQEIADEIEKQVDEFTEEWGVKIENIYIKDIQLSKELQESLSSAAKERRIAESKLISARADVESAKLMRSAADILNSKSAMQIRYLETMKALGQNPSTRVIFLPDLKNKEKIQHLITQGMIS